MLSGGPSFIPCDLSILDGKVPSFGSQTADFYLANLAEDHGLKLATLDEGLKHSAVVLILQENI